MARRAYAALALYVDQAHLGLTLEAALEVAPACGLVPWHANEPAPLRRQNLVAALSEHFVGKPSAQAKAMAVRAGRYATSRWPIARDAGQEASSEVVDQLLFALHQAAPGRRGWPLAWRQILEILQLADRATANATRHHPPEASEAGDHECDLDQTPLRRTG